MINYIREEVKKEMKKNWVFFIVALFICINIIPTSIAINESSGEAVEEVSSENIEEEEDYTSFFIAIVRGKVYKEGFYYEQLPISKYGGFKIIAKAKDLTVTSLMGGGTETAGDGKQYNRTSIENFYGVFFPALLDNTILYIFGIGAFVALRG